MNGDDRQLMFELIGEFSVPLFLVVLGFFTGRVIERRHLASLAGREAKAADVPVTNLGGLHQPLAAAESATLVTGEAVIAADYFQSFVAALVKIIGGELRTYRTLMERARREAMLRMIERARAMGYDEVRNVRLDAFDVAGSATSVKKQLRAMVAVMASGTAVKRGAA